MLRIWDEWVDKKTKGDLNELIKSAYASVNNVKVSWVKDDNNLTIQQWIDDCCDQLEDEGHDLQKTSIDLVREKFLCYDISIVPPKEYKQLQAALEQVNKTLEMLTKFEADESVIDQLNNTIALLTSEMKELS